MWVTAYTDASVKNNNSTWAVWLRSELGRIVRNGKCPLEIKKSHEAELYAAKQAIRIAKEFWPATKGILINSDCTHVLNNIRKFSEGLWIRTKHVKGHQDPNSNIRFYLNNQVDKLASQLNNRKGK